MALQVNRATVVERYEEGETLRGFAEAYKTTRYFITKMFIDLDITRRSRGRQPRDDRWGTHWRKCRVCGETKRKHHSHGLCTTHYRYWHRAGKPKIWNGMVIR